MSEGTFKSVSDDWKAVEGEAVAEEDNTEPEETPEPKKRVTSKPKSKEATFTVIRAFTWHGTKYEVGEHTLPEDEYTAMLYDLNLRTDRQVFIKPE